MTSWRDRTFILPRSRAHPLIVGLTGGLAMGKSSITSYLRQKRHHVFDADAEVRKLYTSCKPLIKKICAISPNSIKNDEIDRKALSAHLLKQPSDLSKIEAVVRPYLRIAFLNFLAQSTKLRRTFCFLDAPLLFEAGYAGICATVWTVSAPPHLQIHRLARRPNLTQDMANFLISRQMPDSQRRAWSDLVIPSSLGHGYTRRYVQKQLLILRERHHKGVTKGPPPRNRNTQRRGVSFRQGARYGRHSG